MGNNLKKLCNSIKIRSTCVSTCCSDNTKQEVILTPIQIPPQHAHHIEHHEHIENIGGVLRSNVILHTIEDKIVCD
jgi:hypothetical protein